MILVVYNYASAPVVFGTLTELPTGQSLRKPCIAHHRDCQSHTDYAAGSQFPYLEVTILNRSVETICVALQSLPRSRYCSLKGPYPLVAFGHNLSIFVTRFKEHIIFFHSFVLDLDLCTMRLETGKRAVTTVLAGACPQNSYPTTLVDPFQRRVSIWNGSVPSP